MIRKSLGGALFFVWLGVQPSAAQAQNYTTRGPKVTAVRKALELRYDANARAYLDKNLPEIMKLRTADFHTVNAEGVARDRAGMEQYIQASDVARRSAARHAASRRRSN